MSGDRTYTTNDTSFNFTIKLSEDEQSKTELMTIDITVEGSLVKISTEVFYRNSPDSAVPANIVSISSP